MKASDPATGKADFKGKRLASTKGSTSELSIKMNGSEPVTFQDTGSAYMAVQQNKALGMVANTMTITNLVNQSKTAGVEHLSGHLASDAAEAGGAGNGASVGFRQSAASSTTSATMLLPANAPLTRTFWPVVRHTVPHDLSSALEMSTV